jgi:hypothetical protein
MRKPFLLIAALLFSVSVSAQKSSINTKAVVYQTGAPSGTCSEKFVVDRVTGYGYTCVAGVWTLAAAGSGISGLTTNTIPKAASATTIGNSSIADTGSAVSTTNPFSAPSLKTTGTSGAGFVELVSQASAPAAPSSGFREFADSTGRKSWIRASDGFVRTWDATLTASRVYTLPDADSKFPVFAQTITFAGPTAARTITVPDANFTVARTDAANAFVGNQTIAVGQTTSAQTDLLINPTTKASGNLIDAQVNGVSKFSVTRTQPLPPPAHSKLRAAQQLENESLLMALHNHLVCKPPSSASHPAVK